MFIKFKSNNTTKVAEVKSEEHSTGDYGVSVYEYVLAVDCFGDNYSVSEYEEITFKQYLEHAELVGAL